MLKSAHKTILNRYIRPPDDIREMTDELLYDDGDTVVGSFVFDMPEPLRSGSKLLFESGFPCIYFVFFDGTGHDILKIFNPDGSFWGYYCDIVTGVKRIPGGFEIIDLFLDVWVEPDGRTYIILDEDEFQEAVADGIVSPAQEKNALRSLGELVAEIENGNFPPPFTRRFTLGPAGHWPSW